MIAILTFLIRYCSALLEKPGVRFKDSKVGRNPGEGSWILLESDDVQVYICNEREAITLEMRSLNDTNGKNWFSFDLIARLLCHETATGVMDTANSDWLSKNLGKIITCFRKENVAATLSELSKLKDERAKRV
jgi:hypothetical protein